jgi:hypothetical protein
MWLIVRFHSISVRRIHLYSDMWRHFDAGLHEFMHTYIYKPLVGPSPSLLGRGEMLNVHHSPGTHVVTPVAG